MTASLPTLSILAFPYARLRPLTGGPKELREAGRAPGSALVWAMQSETDRETARVVKGRPGGMALLAVLPAEAERESRPELALGLHDMRPQGILPFHAPLRASDLSQVLRRPPVDLSAEITDYIRWRGLTVDRDTTHLVRRLLDLSSELKSISAVARSLYISRRALGRRLLTRGLPVPSHWLHMARLLRVAIRLQNSDATISSVAYEHGYPDAFSLSNQMERLLGHRPSQVRRRFGWEWLVEAWLRKEADTGRLTAAIANTEPSFEPRARSRSRRNQATVDRGKHA